MSGSEDRKVPDNAAERAACVLAQHKQVVLERWTARIRERVRERGLEGTLPKSAYVEDARDLIERFLERLCGSQSGSEFAGFYHWAYNGRQYDLRLADVVEVLMDLKDVAREVIREAEQDELVASRLGTAVGATLDGMVKRATELYQVSHEAELNTIQGRFQQILSAWRVEESLTGVESAEEVFRIAYEKLGEILPLVGCVARLYDERGREEKGLSSREGLPIPVLKEQLQYLTDSECKEGGALDMLEACRRRGEPIVYQPQAESGAAVGHALVLGLRAEEEVLNAGQLADAGVHSAACLPLPFGDEVVGALMVLATAPGAFRSDEIRLLRDFADVLGPAFARTAHLEKSRRQMTEAEAVARIGRSLLELPSLEALLQAVVDALQQFRDYDEVALFRTDQEGGQCVLAARAGPLVSQTPGRMRQRVGEGLVGRCAATGRSILTDEQSDAGSDVAALVDGAGPGSGLAVPLKKGGKVIGVMRFTAQRAGAFPQSDQAALTNLATHIAVALQNVEILEEQRRNRRELEQVHQQLSAILRSAAVGITTMDSEGVYTHWSPSCEKMLGYREGEVVGKMRPTDIVARPYDLRDVLNRCVQQGRVTEELVLKRKDSALRTVEQIIVPLADAGGRSGGFTCCLVDITEKKQAQEALRQERDKLDLVVRAMGAGLALFDGELRLQWANDTLMDWFGFDEAAFSRECREVYKCAERDHSFCPLHDAHETGRAHTGIMERTDDAGVWCCYLIVATPVQYGQTRLLSLTLDITEQRRQTEQMQIIGSLTRALEGTLDLDRVLRLVLTCVTAGHALGFNRAFIFLVDSERERLVGSIALGPTSEEEAGRIWREIADQSLTLEELLAVEEPADGDKLLSGVVRSFAVPLSEADNVLVRTLSTHEPLIVRDTRSDPGVGADLAEALKLEEFVCVPLVARDETLGVMLADNRFSRTPVDEHQVELLRMFSAQASLAIANARAYRRIRDQVAQLQQAHQELIESERLASVGRMATHLAHEIRNPLATIGGFARTIGRQRGAGELTRRNASIIYNEVIRLENTLANALDFGRPLRPEKKLVDLKGLITETLREFRGVLQEGGVEVRLELAEDLPPARLDPRMIKQVIINLLKNAWEALEGRERRRITIGAQAEDESISITFSDTGSGVDEETLKALFAPFFTTKVGGTGLGLSITQKIVVEHGGDISVDSEVGKGTSFHITLPREGAEAGRSVEPRPAQEAPGAHENGGQDG